jgi:hypothetical protein
MRLKPEVKELKEWLEANTFGAKDLMNMLDYSTPTTIRAWIARNSIPSYQLDKVLSIIRVKGASRVTRKG